MVDDAEGDNFSICLPILLSAMKDAARLLRLKLVFFYIL